MSDWILDNFGWFLGIFTVGVGALLAVAIVADVRHDNRLMAQCLADGHKEYECAAMLERKSTGTVVMPMPIVVPR